MYFYRTVRYKFPFFQPSPGLHDMYRLLFIYFQYNLLSRHLLVLFSFFIVVVVVIVIVVVVDDDEDGDDDDDYLYNLIMGIKHFITAIFSSNYDRINSPSSEKNVSLVYSWTGRIFIIDVSISISSNINSSIRNNNILHFLRI